MSSIRHVFVVLALTALLPIATTSSAAEPRPGRTVAQNGYWKRTANGRIVRVAADEPTPAVRNGAASDANNTTAPPPSSTSQPTAETYDAMNYDADPAPMIGMPNPGYHPALVPRHKWGWFFIGMEPRRPCVDPAPIWSGIEP